jgi:hypothetical protein
MEKLIFNCQYKIVNFIGGVAQLGERLPCTQEVIGSNPFTSTKINSVDYGRVDRINKERNPRFIQFPRMRDSSPPLDSSELKAQS